MPEGTTGQSLSVDGEYQISQILRRHLLALQFSEVSMVIDEAPRLSRVYQQVAIAGGNLYLWCRC